MQITWCTITSCCWDGKPKHDCTDKGEAHSIATPTKAAVLNETAPPNFSFMDKCRNGRKGGGKAALFKDTFQCKEISFGDLEISTFLAKKSKQLDKTFTPHRPRRKLICL